MSRPAGALRAAFFVSIAPPAVGPLFFFPSTPNVLCGPAPRAPRRECFAPGCWPCKRGSLLRGAGGGCRAPAGRGAHGGRLTWRRGRAASASRRCIVSTKRKRGGRELRPRGGPLLCRPRPRAPRGGARLRRRPAHPRGFAAPRPFVWGFGFCFFFLVLFPSPPLPFPVRPRPRADRHVCPRACVRACAGSCAGGSGRAAAPAPLFGDPTTRSSAAWALVF